METPYLLGYKAKLFLEPWPYDGDLKVCKRRVSCEILSLKKPQEFMSSNQVNLWEVTGTVMQMLTSRSNIQFRLD